jgi:SWI/SNF related-matrix-associated actin-dependent regulator of chromatin subfamily C
MPEFFDGNSISKTPKLYKEYRDFIINKFKENPGKLLTFTEVRRMLPGDVNVIKRLFDFVEYWGLINYQNIPVTKHPESAALSPSSETVPPGVQVVYPHIPAGVSKPKGSVETNGKSSGALSLSSLVSYRDAFVTSTTDAPPTASSESIENLNTLNCSSCGANCELKYYGNTKGVRYYFFYLLYIHAHIYV